jgi:hypothetical protein
VDSLKHLQEYGRTHPISALSQDTGALSSAVRELANNEAMKSQLSYFSQSVKEMTSLAKAYNFNFPVFDSGLFDSLLFKYISSDFRSSYYADDFDFSSEIVSESESAHENYEYFEIDPVIDAEIVHELKRGGDLSRLSFKARQYLDKWWPIMLVVLDLMAHFITFDQYYEQKMATAKSANEIKAVVKSMPIEHREMLEGQSVVIRESVILREKPDTQSKELGRMKMGTRLDVESVRGSWVYVSVDINGEDMKGWVYQQYTLKL